MGWRVAHRQRSWRFLRQAAGAGTRAGLRRRGPGPGLLERHLFTYLPVALRNYPLYEATGSWEAHNDMIRAGFQPGSEFLWDEHYVIYWDLTQRIYREEFDPRYDGPLKAGIPFCQPGTPNCDANYGYSEPDPADPGSGPGPECTITGTRGDDALRGAGLCDLRPRWRRCDRGLRWRRHHKGRLRQRRTQRGGLRRPPQYP
jgi:hypothetical protein